MFRFFRSRELTFWTLAVVALGATAIVAAHLGAGHSTARHAASHFAAPAADNSQARSQVDALVALMPAGVAAGVDRSALTSWSGEIATYAQQGATIRTAEGADTSDPMLTGFTRLNGDANSLTNAAAVPVTAAALRTQIGLDVTYLHQLALGQPAPALPAVGALDPLNRNGALTAPVPNPPALPTAPTLPSKK